MKIKKNKIKSSKLPANGKKKNLTILGGLGLGTVVVAGALFFGLSSMFQTSTYYELRTPVAANTQITPGMLQAQETSKDTQPANTISLAAVESGQVYAKYALDRGDVLLNSNAGTSKGVVSGVPDSWVTTTFNVADSDAASGSIQKGMYFDIIGISGNGRARYLFTDVLALNVQGGSTSTTKTSSGNASTYTVGMPAKDVALLHSALKTYPQIKLVVSPKSVSYGVRDVKGLGDTVSFNGDSPASQDLYKGTDPTFTNVKRNSKGEPQNQKGNPDLKTPSSSSSDD